jgi:hypothetical protein
MKKLGFLLKKMFFLFSSNCYTFFLLLFLIIVVFYTIDYLANNKKNILLPKQKTIHELERQFWQNKIHFTFINPTESMTQVTS